MRKWFSKNVEKKIYKCRSRWKILQGEIKEHSEEIEKKKKTKKQMLE
jgi:hypothetical protein